MCTVLLPPGVNPIAVNKYIVSYHYRSILPMPHLTPDCDRVMIFRLLTPESTHFNMINILKLIQMVMEVRISEDYCRSDIQIYDFSFISVGHVSKITLPSLKKYEMCAIVSVARYILIKNFIQLNSCFHKLFIRIFPFSH
jgi:hypothetical protein